MPELRRDPTTGTWTIVAAERAATPGGPRRAAPPTGHPPHPARIQVCRGHVAETPRENRRWPPAADRWSVRVVPNKYPALLPGPPDAAACVGGLLASLPARGHHEVIVEGPEHRLGVAPPAAEILADVFRAARERHHVFAADPGLRHMALFKNHGLGGGASLPHPHWQIVTSPIVPPTMERQLQLAAEHHATSGRALMDDLLRREHDAGARLVEVTGEFAVLAAFAPQWEGETWIVPRAPGDSLGTMDDPTLTAFADVLWRSLRRVAAALAEPPLNVVIHSAPLRAHVLESFRWHARIQPRLGTQAGFELGSGVAIVTLAPEAAAERLRAQEV